MAPSAAGACSPYEQHRRYVLGVLARRCRWIDPSDREAIFHDAYAVFLEKQRDGRLALGAMQPAQVRAYLTQTALNKAMDEGKRVGRRRSASLDDECLAAESIASAQDLEEQLAGRLEDACVREIVAELPQRRARIIALRFFLDRTPEEVQRYLGVTDRVYRREFERAMREIAVGLELVRRGTFCESRQSVLLAYITGVAGARRAADARRHIANCPACAHWLRQLQSAREDGVAAA